ncbi:MAG TPA: VOC family protein, partial [Bacteroidia bacterium]|nr:VOC family protein [Bacteroidia bacterium]
MDDLTEVKNFKYSETTKIFKEAQDFLPILGTDYVEMYVGNAKQAAHFYKTAFGFQELAYSGLETGQRDKVSYVLQQGKIRLVLTTPFDKNSEISEHIRIHGDGVKVIALWVEDAYDAFEQTTKRGAKAYVQPHEKKDENGVVRISGIHTYGDTVHLFIERKNYKGLFLPGFEKWETEYQPHSMGLKYIDHMVGNVGMGEMNIWSKFYGEVMGFFNL